MAQLGVRLDADFKTKVWGFSMLEPWCASDGRPIGEVWFTDSEALPLPARLIFAEEDFTVQVHPDDSFPTEHQQSCGKTEMPDVLRAARRARVAIGFREETSRGWLRGAAVRGEIMELPSLVESRPGHTFFMAAGRSMPWALALPSVKRSNNPTSHALCTSLTKQ
jgi:hypothetical protein